MEQKIGTPFNMKNAATDIENIEAHYLEKGYQYAKVERMKIHPNGTLVLELSEGEVQNVSWRGADEKLNTQLLNASLSIQPGSVYKAQGINRDRQQLLQSGFFSSVSMPIVQQKINPSGLDMTYVVKEKSKNSFDIGLEQLRYEDGLAIFSAYQRRHFIIYSDLF